MVEALRATLGVADILPSAGIAAASTDSGEVPPEVQPATPGQSVIAALCSGTVRPFWSVMIPVYNCPEHYLPETLQSVLAQDPGAGEMQIEVVDNCSTVGDCAALVRELGGGRVAYHRQSSNIGMVANFNDCIRRATGHWVHILHGDDTVREGFYACLRRGIDANPGAGAALCRTIFVDADSQWRGLSEPEARLPGVLDEDFTARQLIDQRIQCPSIVVKRATYEELGGFRTTLSHCLDWDMWKRIAMRKPVYYDPEPLACYRMHDATDSSRLMRSGANVADERRSIALSCEEVPPDHAANLRRAALRAAGVRAARRARVLWKDGERVAAWRQMTEAMRCSLAPSVVVRAVYFVLRTVVH